MSLHSSAEILPAVSDENCTPSLDGADSIGVPQEQASLCWRVHLLRTEPGRLPVVLMALGLGAGCVWLMFGAWLPTLAALLLLAGSTSEYLLPITYRITPEGVYQESSTSRFALPWKDARRCRVGKRAVLLTSLPAPSRLDAFRGVLLRFAPLGQSGDRDSVLAVLACYAPSLLVLNLD